MVDHTPTPLDWLAMIAIRAQQINASVTATVAGASPPSPTELRRVLDEMSDITDRFERAIAMSKPNG